MSEITFKATRRLHSSGYRHLEKSGNLEFDMDAHSSDGVWIMTNAATMIMIDCDKSGTYHLKFQSEKVQLEDTL
jgi:hypothetical protein